MKVYAALAAAALTFTLSTNADAAIIDTIQAPSGFFTPAGQELSFPYFRGPDEDWEWQHNPIAAGFTSAKLNISAYDVDEAPCGQNICEVDNIYAYDGSSMTWLLLGALTGDNNAFSFTEFDIFGFNGGVLIDDIIAGLRVKIDIDANLGFWGVSLAKSVITTDGANPGNPNPGVIPLPAAGWLMLAGLGGLAALRRRRGEV